MTRWRIAGISFDHMHMGDLLRMVHEHGETVGPCQLDREHLGARKCAFHLARNCPRQFSLLVVRRRQNALLFMKNGPLGPISHCLKYGICRIATSSDRIRPRESVLVQVSDPDLVRGAARTE